MNFKKKVSGSWVDVPHYVSGTGTETITTLPDTIYPLAQTATIGLKGNTVQNGTPTPTNPIQPSECGERTGNLWDGSSARGYVTADGSFIEPDTTTITLIVPVIGGNTYTITKTGSPVMGTKFRIVEFTTYPVNGTVGTVVYDNDSATTYTLTTASSTKYVACYVNYAGRPIVPNIMFNEGSTALPYEPWGIKIPISSGGQTTPVYLGEVKSTRRIKKYELTGNEDITYQSAYSRFFFTIADAYYNGTPRTTPCVCSHYQPIHDGRSIDDVPNESIYVGALYDVTSFNIKTTDFTDVTDFKTYIAQQYAAGTPVTVWYVLATPETGIVNEPLMKIGDYADTVSGITIPTIAGANTLSVDTTLQPSEVTVNYKGWHPVQSVHEYEDGNDNYIPDLNTLTTTVSNCAIESVSNNTLVLSGNGYTGSFFSQIISNDVMIPSNLIGKTVTLSGSITWSSEGNIVPRVTIMMHRSGSTDYNVSLYQGAFTQTFEVPSDATSYALLFRIDQNRSEYVGTARVTYTNIELKEQPHWN